jgi:hypothetical protein
MKYLLLFHGGNIPENKKQQSIIDRLAWMDDLRSQSKFIDGSPLVPEGEAIANTIVATFNHGSDSINGYAIIEANDIDEAVMLSKTAPQLWEEYGAASVEVRQLQPISK